MAKKITMASIIMRDDKCKCADLQDELVMIHLERGAYYAMDRIGKSIWMLLDQPRTVSSLCEELGKNYEVPPTQCQAEVIEFLEKLWREKLIHVD